MTSQFKSSMRPCDSNAHVFRASSGSLVLDGSGLITQVGSSTSQSSISVNAFQLKPDILGGAAVDLSYHFAFWKLHAFIVKYVPLIRPATTSIGTLMTPGIGVIGFSDDPGRVQSGASATTLTNDCRVSVQFAYDKPFTLKYVPAGTSAGWLQTSMVSAISNTALRQCSAGHLTWASVIASSFVSGAVGRFTFEYEISFKGSAVQQTPSLAVESKVELKSAVVSRDKAEEDYEMLDLRLKPTELRRSAGTLAVEKLASVKSDVPQSPARS